MQDLLRPTSLKRSIFFITFDILFSFITLYLTYAFRFNFDIPSPFLETFWIVFYTLVVLKVGALFWFRSYFVVWRFFGFEDAKRVVQAHLIAYGCFALIYFLWEYQFAPFPRSVILIDFFLSLIFIGGFRVSKRFLYETRLVTPIKPTLLIGVNSNTSTMIKSALHGDIDYYPSAILALADEKSAHNSYIHNVKVYSYEKLEKLVTERAITSVIITTKLEKKILNELIARLNHLGVKEIKKVKLLGNKRDKLKDISIEDLLARYPKDLDTKSIALFIKGKSVLITGAGGSIGSEIVRQCKAFGASHMTLVDNSEYNLYQIGEEVQEADLKLLSVTDKPKLEALFAQTKPQIVIHAAAYKHVPLCEANISTAIENNIVGSKNVIDSSIQYGVKRVVIISTDKAVRPTNVMGATKRVVELYANNVQSKQTEIVAVRFGNVLGSSGSVIPKFKAQIQAGQNLTVTHPEITRYFMLIHEACQLVLQAGSIAKGGELFILDMGEPVKIVDLATQMLRLYGKENELGIDFTGLRAGEKLYEELLLNESDKQTKYPSIFIGKPTNYPIEVLTQDIQALLEAEDKIKSLQKIVPEFIRNS